MDGAETALMARAHSRRREKNKYGVGSGQFWVYHLIYKAFLKVHDKWNLLMLLFSLKDYERSVNDKK